MRTLGVDQAFPVAINETLFANGLTKREYFAALALQGLLADSSVDAAPIQIAKASVRMADALIEALNA